MFPTVPDTVPPLFEYVKIKLAHKPDQNIYVCKYTHMHIDIVFKTKIDGQDWSDLMQ